MYSKLHSVITATLFALILMLLFKDCEKSQNDGVYKRSVILHDTIFKDTGSVKIDTLEIPSDVDTLAILSAYFVQHEYTLFDKVKGSHEIKFKPVISMNKIDSFDYEIKNLRKSEVNKIYLSLHISKNNLTPSIHYQRNRWGFGVGYNLIDPSLSFTVNREIFSW